MNGLTVIEALARLKSMYDAAVAALYDAISRPTLFRDYLWQQLEVSLSQLSVNRTKTYGNRNMHV